MTPARKSVIGLLAALAAGAISHGPLGRGEGFIAGIDRAAQAVVRDAGITGVTLAMERDPLSRRARLDGPADRFQREGQGSLPGLDDRLLTVPGLRAVEWTAPPPP